MVVLYSIPGEYGSAHDEYRRKLIARDEGSWPAENDKLREKLAEDSDLSLNQKLMEANQGRPLHVGDLSLLREEASYDYTPAFAKTAKKLAEKNKKLEKAKTELEKKYEGLKAQAESGKTKQQKDERLKNLESDRKAEERLFVVEHRKATQPLVRDLNIEYRKVGKSRLKQAFTEILKSKIFHKFANRIQGVILVPMGPNVVPVGTAANILGHALSVGFPVSPEAIQKFKFHTARKTTEVGVGGWRDDLQAAPTCKVPPGAQQASLVLVPVMLADIAKLWASWYGPAMASAQDAARDDRGLVESLRDSADNWSAADQRLTNLALSQEERTKLIKQVFADPSASFLLSLAPEKINDLYRAGLALNQGLTYVRGYRSYETGLKRPLTARGFMSESLSVGSIDAATIAALSTKFNTPQDAKYIFFPVGKPVAPSDEMVFPSATRSNILAGVAGFLADSLKNKTDVVAIANSPNSRYDIKSFSRELKKRFVHDRVKATRLTPGEAMCQLITVNGYIGLKPHEVQRRFRPGPYLDQFLNQKVALILCETGAEVNGRQIREFTSKQLRALVKEIRVENHIFSLESLLDYAEALQARDAYFGETVADLDQDTKDFSGYVNYKFLTTEEKGPVNAFYEYAREHMPGRPEVICTFDATKLDDDVIVRASVVMLWPAIRQNGMLGLKTRVATGDVEFSRLGELATAKASEAAEEVEADSYAILEVISKNLTDGNEKALKIHQKLGRRFVSDWCAHAHGFRDADWARGECACATPDPGSERKIIFPHPESAHAGHGAAYMDLEPNHLEHGSGCIPGWAHSG